MAYTDPWNEALPTGNESGDQIDDIIRRLMKQIRERMNTILGGANWAADPIGVLAGHKMVQHWSAGSTVSGAPVVGAAGDYVGPSNGGNIVFAVPFMIPIGATIRRLYINGVATGISTINCRLVQIPPGYAGFTELTNFTITMQAGWDGGQSALLDVENDDVYSYYVRVSMFCGFGEQCAFNDLTIEYDKANVLVGN